MKLFPHIDTAAVLVLSVGGILVLGAVDLAAETFTLETARAAADKGDPQAEFFLARQYAHGLGVPRDYTQSVKFLRQAATQGYAPAQTGLGSCFAHGEGVQQDYVQAVQWYLKAANQDEPLAEFCMGQAYAHGIGAAKNMNAALAWWQKAAVKGQPDAENALGQFYLNGEHPGDTNHINDAKAAQWFQKAAEHNYAPAMGALGYMYLYGVGMGQDWTKALQWNSRAADLNDGIGQENLGQMYENGYAGLPHDLVQAYKWFWLSELQGNKFGEHDVIEIELHHALTLQQIDEAKRLANEFRAQLHSSRPAAASGEITDSNELSK